MRRFLSITKALADETRLRILMALREEETCVCQLIALLKLAPSTVSRHIFLLAHAGLIEKRKSGKWIHCRLAGSKAPQDVKAALALTVKALAGVEKIAQDARHLTDIRSRSLEEVCEPLQKKRKKAGCR